MPCGSVTPRSAIVDLVKRPWDDAVVARTDPNDPRLDPVVAAQAAVRDAEQALQARRDELAEAVADAIRNGVRPSAIVRKTGYSAESIRQMARSKGIDPLRPPTVTSIRNLPADHPLRRGAESDES